jgi:hypothetical protein
MSVASLVETGPGLYAHTTPALSAGRYPLPSLTQAAGDIILCDYKLSNPGIPKPLSPIPSPREGRDSNAGKGREGLMNYLLLVERFSRTKNMSLRQHHRYASCFVEYKFAL